jgi:hypothetical protein
LRRRLRRAEDTEQADEYEQVDEKSGERFFHGELSFEAWITGNSARTIEPAAANDNVFALGAAEAMTACY